MAAEDVGMNAWRKGGFPALALRLPDVWGEYNNLGGFLDLIEDCEQHKPLAAKSPWGDSDGWAKEHRVSLVYAPDVASAIAAATNNRDAVTGKILTSPHRKRQQYMKYTRSFTNACMEIQSPVLFC